MFNLLLIALISMAKIHGAWYEDPPHGEHRRRTPERIQTGPNHTAERAQRTGVEIGIPGNQLNVVEIRGLVEAQQPQNLDIGQHRNWLIRLFNFLSELCGPRIDPPIPPTPRIVRTASRYPGRQDS